MEDRNSSDFKFSVDDSERPDSLFQAKRENIWRENRRLEKLSRRVTIIFIITLFLVGGMAFFIYLEIDKRFIEMHSTGSTEVQNLSRELEEKITAISSKYAEIEGSLGKKIAATEENASKLEKSGTALEDLVKGIEKKLTAKLGKVEKSVKELRVSDADKAGAIEKSLAPVRKELERLKSLDPESVASSIEKKMTAELEKIAGTIKNPEEDITNLKAELDHIIQTMNASGERLNRLEEDVSGLPSDMIGKEKLDVALEEYKDAFYLSLESQKENYQEKINKINKSLKDKENTIRVIRNKLKEVEAALSSGRRYKSGRSKKPKNETLKPGKIIEKDIE
ncbi:hypothetical protein QUF80_16655 [Desulfococcaceae bacterium HSG8]|nr:hypothetical protein [Desulfococcaceae bacterium HSG8]